MTASFDLHLLGWSDFQSLCHTVTREVLGQTVVGYLDQDDGGRDGAFFGEWAPRGKETLAGSFVVQAKHTSIPNSLLGPADLADEIDKAARLHADGRCDVWVLMTNARMTGRTEEELARELRTRGIAQSLILSSTWINQTISESSRLRMLVPRLYGLGDLTQILDERAYRQATAVLESMRTDLAKLVRTETYERAAAALDKHGFVLLVGAPATGKTTIAAELSLAAADAFDTQVVTLEDAMQLAQRWNPDERQLFWLDDAFGATQLNPFLASNWQRMTPKIRAAIEGGSKFVLTTRDYILKRAWSHLKPGSFPLLNGAQVVVDVTSLALRERRQILYNHLKHGRQPTEFVRDLVPHLDKLAEHRGFTPELARRLADPAFTGSVRVVSSASLTNFFDKPRELLADIFAGLDNDSMSALGLIFLGRGWLPSPVELDGAQVDLLLRLGGSLATVTRALAEMDGSLVVHVTRDGETGWVFTHPTMIDTFADTLRTPDLMHLLVHGFGLRVLMDQTTCGDVGYENALVLPDRLWSAMLDRLDEPLGPEEDGWHRWSRRRSYIASQCVPEFQQLYLDRHPDLLDKLASPGLMLDAAPDNEFIALLHQSGVLPEDIRRRFVHEAVDYCICGLDSGILSVKRLRDMLTRDEEQSLLDRLLAELVPDPGRVLAACIEGVSSENDAESLTYPVEQFADALQAEFPDREEVRVAAERIRTQREEWVRDHSDDEPEAEPDVGSYQAGPATQTADPVRSVFDDLVSDQ